MRNGAHAGRRRKQNTRTLRLPAGAARRARRQKNTDKGEGGRGSSKHLTCWRRSLCSARRAAARCGPWPARRPRRAQMHSPRRGWSRLLLLRAWFPRSQHRSTASARRTETRAAKTTRLHGEYFCGEISEKRRSGLGRAMTRMTSTPRAGDRGSATQRDAAQRSVDEPVACASRSLPGKSSAPSAGGKAEAFAVSVSSARERSAHERSSSAATSSCRAGTSSCGGAHAHAHAHTHEHSIENRVRMCVRAEGKRNDSCPHAEADARRLIL